MGSGSWSSLSDPDAKANVNAVDSQALLARFAALPIATWNYKTQPDSVRHMGPMAQDFCAAFGLKQDLGDKERQIAELRGRLAHLEQRQ